MGLLIGGTLAYLFLPSPWWIVVVAVLAAFEGLEVWFWLWLRRRRVLAGPESLVGERGVMTDAGRVRIRGTTYRAEAGDARAGEAVVVERAEGLTLVVRRA